MKYKFEDGTEKDLSFKEMRDIEALFRIDCIYDWLSEMEIKYADTKETISDEDKKELAEGIWEKVDNNDYISQEICDVENEALNKLLEECHYINE